MLSLLVELKGLPSNKQVELSEGSATKDSVVEQGSSRSQWRKPRDNEARKVNQSATGICLAWFTCVSCEPAWESVVLVPQLTPSAHYPYVWKPFWMRLLWISPVLPPVGPF